MKVDQFAAWWLVVRDIAIVASALGWLWFEVVFYDGPERRWPYVVCVGLLGLPAFLRRAERSASTPTPEREH